MIRKMSAVVFLMALIGVTAPLATADQDNKDIRFTIKGPVEVPGVVLAPGTYDLKLLGNGSGIAEIWSVDRPEFYGFFETAPVYRNHTTMKTSVVLESSEKTVPKRIDEWFYSGDHHGNEFVYPPLPIAAVH